MRSFEINTQANEIIRSIMENDKVIFENGIEVNVIASMCYEIDINIKEIEWTIKEIDKVLKEITHLSNEDDNALKNICLGWISIDIFLLEIHSFYKNIYTLDFDLSLVDIKLEYSSANPSPGYCKVSE